MPVSKPWIHPNSSSSSLKGMEIAIPPGHTFPAPSSQSLLPPPEAVRIYEVKPLPPVPARRSQASSSFSAEVNSAFKTPKRSVDYQENVFDFEKGGGGGGGEEAVSVPAVPAAPATRPKVNVPCIPETASPVHIFSPQPLQSVRKILRLAGSTASSNSPTTGDGSPSSLTTPTGPSGHNSSQKIKQLTGLDIGDNNNSDSGYYDYTDVAAEGKEVPPASPPSSRSSAYSRDGAAEAANSSCGRARHYHHHHHRCCEGASRQAECARCAAAASSLSWAPASPSVAASLHTSQTRAAIFGRHSDPALSPVDHTSPLPTFPLPPTMTSTAPCSEPEEKPQPQSPPSQPSPSPAPRHGRRSSLCTDLYHATAMELAQCSPSTAAPIPLPQDSSTARASGAGTPRTVRIAPPPLELLSPSRPSSSPAGGREPPPALREKRIKTPYPPWHSYTSTATAPSAGADGKSVFEVDSSSSSSSSSGGDKGEKELGSPKRWSALSKRARVFTPYLHLRRGSRRDSSSSGLPSSPASPLISGDAAASTSPGSNPKTKTKSKTKTKTTTLIANRNRKPDGPDTPFPLSLSAAPATPSTPWQQLASGLVAQAARTWAGRAKEEDQELRRRESLKRKIRVVHEAPLEEEVGE